MSARIAIAGGPRTGKTTFAQALGAGLGVASRSTDDLMGGDWSAASLAASRWFDAPGALIVEGVAVPRALRKWLAANPTGKPVDKVIWIHGAKTERSKGQETMSKGCTTVWREILPELQARGVEIVEAA